MVSLVLTDTKKNYMHLQWVLNDTFLSVFFKEVEFYHATAWKVERDGIIIYICSESVLPIDVNCEFWPLEMASS